MQREGIYIGLFLMSVFISSISQIVLKKSAEQKYESKIREYLNAPVIVAYTLFFSASLLTVLAYRAVPLSLGPVLEATGYVWVAVLGRIFLRERLNKNNIIGMVMIVFGIIIFNIG